MKNLILFLLFFIICYSLFISHCEAQWSNDIRLTNAPNSSFLCYNNARSFAQNSNIVHIVWVDNRDANSEIYYKRSTDEGVNWGTDIRLTNYTGISMDATVAVSGLNVYVVWTDSRDGNYEIYYKNSSDEGVTWGNDTRLTNNSASSYRPSISISGSVIHLVWYDGRDGNDEIYYKRSTDLGLSWGADMRLTNSSGSSYYPSIASYGNIVHVSWHDMRDGNREVYYNQSTDGGTTWGTDLRLTNDTAYSYYTSIGISGSVVHIVWSDYRDGDYEVYYKHSTNNGLNWGSDTRLTNSSGESGYPSISVSGLNVHIVWHDMRDGNWEIYYKYSSNGGSSWDSDIRLTNNSAYQWGPSVLVYGSIIHVAWRDYRDGNDEIYYKRNPTGNPTGISNINTGIPKEFRLEQNYPNPFNPTTKIKFDLPKSNLTLSEAKGLFVQLKIYDLTGKEIQTLVNEQLLPGTYEVTFDGSNLSSGVYFYKLSAGDYLETKKFILLK